MARWQECPPYAAAVRNRLLLVFAFVTGKAACGTSALLMTAHTAAHGGDDHAGDWPVTGFACDVSLKMSAMTPEHPIGHFILPHPDDLLLAFGEIAKLLQVRTLFRDCDVADHALPYRGKRHRLAGIGIAMAIGAFQFEQ